MGRYPSPLTRDAKERGIDLTPMLDVVFIMLIFFIVTAVFVKERGLDVAAPEKSENPKPNKALIVNIDANDYIWVEKKPVDVRNVRAHLSRLHAERPESPLVVDADPLSSTNALVSVMDQARAAGISNVNFAK